jgi:hypothetical protein
LLDVIYAFRALFLFRSDIIQRLFEKQICQFGGFNSTCYVLT